MTIDIKLSLANLTPSKGFSCFEIDFVSRKQNLVFKRGRGA